MQLPNEAEFVLPNLVLPTIVFLALGLGVGIGIVLSICSYSICLVKSKKKEEDVAMEPVLPRLLFLGEKSVFLYCFGELLWQHLFV